MIKLQLFAENRETYVVLKTHYTSNEHSFSRLQAVLVTKV